MTAAALWTKHRPLARAIASQWRIPGMDRCDVEQEALIALWQAARSYDPSRGASFPTWAARTVRGRLTDLLRAATRAKRTGDIVELDDAPAADTREGRARLQAVVAALPSLTTLERHAVAAQLSGRLDLRDRRLENALQRARRKLRQAA